MIKLNLKQQEEIFKEIFLRHFNKNDFIYFHEYQNSYFRNFVGNTLNEFAIGGKTGSKIHGFVHHFAFLEIENLILDIGLPNYDLTPYLLKQNYFFTVRNNHINLSYNTEKRPVETERDCVEYCQSIIEYMETDGKAFVERYSYLPNVLEEMDLLTANGKYWNDGVLGWSGEPYFRGLIISKLCNDPKYQSKVDILEGIYNPPQNKLQDFIPYFQKLKKRLETIEPIYNIV